MEKIALNQEFEALKVEDVDNVLTVRFNRPDSLNALSKTMGSELVTVFREVVPSSGASVVVLIGESGNFMAGADLSLLEMWQSLDTKQLQESLSNGFFASMLEDAEIPVIAAVDGIAFGLGLDIALAADFVIVTDRVSFGLPEVGVGVVPLGASTHFLPHRIGLDRALRVVMLGEKFTGIQAFEWGLAMKVVPPEELESAAMEVCTKLKRGSQTALRAAKKLLRTSPALSPQQASENEFVAFASCLRAPDLTEGIAAVRERRRPNFSSHRE